MNFNFPHLYVKEMESTNQEALTLLSKTKPSNGFLVITDYQTAGKGQYGRNWQSEANKNLLFSLILGPFNLAISDLFRLHLASSLAVIRSLKELQLSKLSIKWPNDILVGDKKIAGILIQNQLKTSIIEWSIIGMGINVNQTQFPAELSATSIQLENGLETSREEIVSDIRYQILDILASTHKTGWDLVWKEYNSSLYLKDEMVAFTKKNGIKFTGKIISVTKEGLLRIQNLNNQFEEFSFGEIHYKKKVMSDKLTADSSTSSLQDH